MTDQIVVCPWHHKSDCIRKIEAIVASQSGTIPRYDDEGYRYNAPAVSNLAVQLAKPDEPGKPNQGGCLILILLWIFVYPYPIAGVLVGLMGILRLVTGTKPDLIPNTGFLVNVVAAIVLIVASIVFAIWLEMFRRSRRLSKMIKYEKAFRQWKLAKAKWERSYYCKIEHKVFDPATSDSASAGELNNFVYCQLEGGMS